MSETKMTTALEALHYATVKTRVYCPPFNHRQCRRGDTDDVSCDECTDNYLRSHIKGYAEKYPQKGEPK